MLYEPVKSIEDDKVIGAKLWLIPTEIETLIHILEKCLENKDIKLWDELMIKSMLETMNNTKKEEK